MKIRDKINPLFKHILILSVLTVFMPINNSQAQDDIIYERGDIVEVKLSKKYRSRCNPKAKVLGQTETHVRIKIKCKDPKEKKRLKVKANKIIGVVSTKNPTSKKKRKYERPCMVNGNAFCHVYGDDADF